MRSVRAETGAEKRVEPRSRDCPPLSHASLPRLLYLRPGLFLSLAYGRSLGRNRSAGPISMATLLVRIFFYDLGLLACQLAIYWQVGKVG